MALTMTRTRTQTTLDRLSKMIANIHGELAGLDTLIATNPEHGATLRARQTVLLANRHALYETLKQFDRKLNPSDIGCRNDWTRPYGSPGSKLGLQGYFQALIAERPK